MIKVASHSETLPLTEVTEDVITLSVHRIHPVDGLLLSDGSRLSDIPDGILSFQVIRLLKPLATSSFKTIIRL